MMDDLALRMSQLRYSGASELCFAEKEMAMRGALTGFGLALLSSLGLLLSPGA